MIDLYRLQHFVALAREGSYVRAAETLSLSQPALSRSIQALERQWATRLFDRGRGGVTLTPVGRALYEQTEELLHHADTMDCKFQQILSGERGRVRFGIGPWIASMLLPELLGILVSDQPDIHIEVVIGDDDEMRDLLLVGQLDFFVGRLRQGIDPLDRLTMKSLGVIHPGLYVREEHPLTMIEELTLKDLGDYPSASGTAFAAELHDLDPEIREALAPAIELDSFDLLAQITRSTDIVLIAGNAMKSHGLVQLPFHITGRPGSGVALVQPDGRAPSPAALVTLDALLPLSERILDRTRVVTDGDAITRSDPPARAAWSADPRSSHPEGLGRHSHDRALPNNQLVV